jgi:NADP-dependent 3-hydroxy acid dehydrogenase YdfG
MLVNGYNKSMPTALIAGIDSAIGESIASSLLNDAWRVLGTSRRDETIKKNSTSFFCDYSDSKSIDKCVSSIIQFSPEIDLLILAVGILDPIGKYHDVDFDKGEEGFYTNCIGP